MIALLALLLCLAMPVAESGCRQMLADGDTRSPCGSVLAICSTKSLAIAHA